MEFHPVHDQIQHTQSGEDEILGPEVKRHILMNVVAIILFVMILFGIIGMLLIYSENPNLSPFPYFLCLGIIVGGGAAMSFFLNKEAHMAERATLGHEFQGRFKQLERRASDLDELLELVADHQPSAVVVFDRHNRFLFINEPAAKQIGKPAIEIIGKPPIKVYSNEVAKKLEIRLAAARASDEPIEMLDKIMSSDGRIRFIQSRYEGVVAFSSMSGCVMVREDDLTNLMIEKERREEMFRQVIETLVAVVDRRDPYATGHSSRVGKLAKAVATEMGLEPDLVDAAEIAGSLMNFGKVLVSRRILTKTSALAPEELQRVRDSILVSADILSIISFNGPVVPTLRQVLERFDGSGEPEHLKGDQILITARIVSAANAFVAFVSPRAHREGLSFQEALRVLGGDADKAFDEQVLLAMTRYIEKNEPELDWLRGQGARMPAPKELS